MTDFVVGALGLHLMGWASFLPNAVAAYGRSARSVFHAALWPYLLVKGLLRD